MQTEKPRFGPSIVSVDRAIRSLTASNVQPNAPSNTQVPNEIKPFRKLHGIGTRSPWFDTGASVQPTTAGFGNMGQNVYSGPALVTFDSSLQKTFDIHDETNLSLRVQAFNALNHPVFANPSTSLTSTSFGHVTSTLGSAGSTAGSRALQIAATLHF